MQDSIVFIHIILLLSIYLLKKTLEIKKMENKVNESFANY